MSRVGWMLKFPKETKFQRSLPIASCIYFLLYVFTKIASIIIWMTAYYNTYCDTLKNNILKIILKL